MPIYYDIDQRTDEWHALRSGIPTASEFGSLVAPSTLKPSKSATPYAYRLAGEAINGPGVGSWGGNTDTARGNWLEEQAADYYAFVSGEDVKPGGFITDDDKTMGCSPDGLIGEDGMLEIKCKNPEKHVAHIVSCVKTGVLPPDHRLQVQGQLMISERRWCDVILYHANLPPYIMRVLPDEEIHTALLGGITELIKTRDDAIDILQKL